ncbi:DMT family transporter [Limnohabitans planktonicus]|uniref:EamA family transporter n=1 Tax=Limnohabitans planktonicus II-D5 TaxID=1293045 RepID=A0A2T7UC28_9BURK|nr:DMT family transporter [Limnohabitans planktonicus]PVE42249.1 EamA family transporter [Limnohabitans planktonicus II-D5]|eukprot:gene3380-3308_t
MLKTAESRHRLALWLLWITPAMWSVNYLVARTAPGVVEPHMLALGRWALAGLILSFLARHELWREKRSTLRAARQYLVLGALGMLICGAWVYKGAQTTAAMNIALIYAASPVLIALGAVLWLGERFSWRQGLGVVIALSGVFHVVVKGQWLALGQVQWVAGDGWIVLAMVAWAAYALLQKKWTSPLSATARLAAICMGGVLVLLPFAVWEGLQSDTPAWSFQASWLVLIAALVPGIGAYGAYGFCQKVLGASRVAASLYLGPLYGGLAAWAVLGESMGWHHLMGALLILPGIYLASRQAPETPEP